jgi:hypothetical protein
MKNLINFLNKKGIILKEIEEISPSIVGSKKRVKIFCGTSIEGKYYLFLILNNKTRLLTKNIEQLQELYDKLASYKDHQFKYVYLFYSSDICSKALKYLKTIKWKSFHDTL